MKTHKTTEAYYTVREGEQPFYNVQIRYDDNSRKIIKYLSKHPEALSRTVIVIYWTCSGDEECELKLYDTVEECVKGIKIAHSGEERIVRIIKRKRIVIEEEITIVDSQLYD